MPYRQTESAVDEKSASVYEPETKQDVTNSLTMAVSALAGMGGSADEQGSCLGQSTNGNLARAGNLLLQMQNQYGNQHVQNVINQTRTNQPMSAQSRPPVSNQGAPIQRMIDDGTQQPLQFRREGEDQPGGRHPNNTGLSDRLKSGLETMSGLDMSDVRVHRNSAKPAQVNAYAYAQGSNVYLGPGQEKHLPHEAWHVVQQKQGRVVPTIQTIGVPINDDPGLEREADKMGLDAVQSRPEAYTPLPELALSPNRHSAQGGVVQGKLVMEDTNENAWAPVRKKLIEYNKKTPPSRNKDKVVSLIATINSSERIYELDPDFLSEDINDLFEVCTLIVENRDFFLMKKWLENPELDEKYFPDIAPQNSNIDEYDDPKPKPKKKAKRQQNINAPQSAKIEPDELSIDNFDEFSQQESESILVAAGNPKVNKGGGNKLLKAVQDEPKMAQRLQNAPAIKESKEVDPKALVVESVLHFASSIGMFIGASLGALSAVGIPVAIAWFIGATAHGLIGICKMARAGVMKFYDPRNDKSREKKRGIILGSLVSVEGVLGLIANIASVVANPVAWPGIIGAGLKLIRGLLMLYASKSGKSIPPWVIYSLKTAENIFGTINNFLTSFVTLIAEKSWKIVLKLFGFFRVIAKQFRTEKGKIGRRQIVEGGKKILGKV